MKCFTKAVLCLFFSLCLSAPALADSMGCCEPDPTYTPGMPEYHCVQGNSYYGQGLYDLAVESYHAALEIDPSSYNAHHGLAIAYRAQGRLDLALLHYGEVIRLHPDYAQPYQSRAEIYQLMGRFADAENDLNSFIEYYGQYPTPYLARGDFFMSQHAYARAAEDYAMAIQRNPNLLEAYLKCIEALGNGGTLGDAVPQTPYSRDSIP